SDLQDGPALPDHRDSSPESADEDEPPGPRRPAHCRYEHQTLHYGRQDERYPYHQSAPGTGTTQGFGQNLQTTRLLPDRPQVPARRSGSESAGPTDHECRQVHQSHRYKAPKPDLPDYPESDPETCLPAPSGPMSKTRSFP